MIIDNNFKIGERVWCVTERDGSLSVVCSDTWCAEVNRIERNDSVDIKNWEGLYYGMNNGENTKYGCKIFKTQIEAINFIKNWTDTKCAEIKEKAELDHESAVDWSNEIIDTFLGGRKDE